MGRALSPVELLRQKAIRPFGRFPKTAQLVNCSTVWLRGLDSNQQPPGYEPGELPNCSTPLRTPRNLTISGGSFKFCRGRGSNPHELYGSEDFKSPASTGSATPAPQRAGNGIRTRDLHLGKVALYQLSYSRLQPHYTKGTSPASSLVRRAGFEPARLAALAPKASASANSATFAPHPYFSPYPRKRERGRHTPPPVQPP